MPEDAESLLQHAREKAATARSLLDLGAHGDAVSRAYYAMFSAARALLAAKGVRPRTHAGVFRELGRLYVKPGILGLDLASAMQEARDRREDADYGAPARVPEDEAEALVADAERFIDAAEKSSEPDPQRAFLAGQGWPYLELSKWIKKAVNVRVV